VPSSDEFDANTENRTSLKSIPLFSGAEQKRKEILTPKTVQIIDLIALFFGLGENKLSQKK
jgi:hypothetical protein